MQLMNLPKRSALSKTSLILARLPETGRLYVDRSPQSISSFWLATLIACVTIPGIAMGLEESAPVAVPAVPQPAQPPPVKRMSLPQKAIRYARHCLRKHDVNGDGILQKDEWMAMNGHPERIDSDQDGIITLDELANWFADYQRRSGSSGPSDQRLVAENAAATEAASQDAGDLEAGSPESETRQSTNGTERHRDQKFYVSAKRLPAGLPDWFFERDKDGDGQLTQSEFSTTGVTSEVAEFEKYDANRDGVLTAKEFANKGHEKAKTVAQPASDGLPAPGSEKQSRGRRKPQAAK